MVTQADGLWPLATTSPSVGAYAPADLRSAYALSASAGVGQTVAIVDALDNPNAEADLAAYRSRFGLVACTTASGCFHKVNQSGASSPLPTGDTGWGQEIDLDLDMASAACPNCYLVLVEANSTSYSDPRLRGGHRGKHLSCQRHQQQLRGQRVQRRDVSILRGPLQPSRKRHHRQFG